MKRIQRYTARNHRRFPTNATNIRVGVAASASTPQVYTTTSTTASVSSAASTSRRGAASVSESLFASAANPAPSLPIVSRRALVASTSSAAAASAATRHRLPPATLLPAFVALYHSPFASRSHLESLSEADGHLWSVLRLRAQLQGDALARQAHLLRLVAVNAQTSAASSARARQSDAMAGLLLPSVMQRGREVAKQTNDFLTAVVATFLCLFLF